MTHPLPVVRACSGALLLALGTAHAAPPVAAVKPVTETYFGTTVTDPYRYMEDLSSPEVQAWAKGQSDYARSVLDAIPGRAPLLKRIAELEASVQARVGKVRRLPGDLYFYEKRNADANQFKIYLRRGLNGEEKLLIDPDALAKAAGKPYAVNFFQPSDSGRYLAYGLSEGGSEEASIHVLEVATGREVIEPIDRAHYSEASWMPDDSGFFYLRQRDLPKGTVETEKYRFQTAFFHRLKGKGPDQPIIEAGNSKAIAITPEESPYVAPLTGTPYVIAIPANGVQNEFALYIAPRADVLKPDVKWRKLFGSDAAVTGFAIHGDDLYLLSHQDAPRFKVLKTSVRHPDLAHAEEVLAAGREVVSDIEAAKDGLYLRTRDGTLGKLYRVAYAKGAKPEAVALPREGSLAIDSVDPRLPGAVISIGSWTRDFGFYAPDPKTGEFVDTGLQALGPYGAPPNLESKEVLVKSYDGVEVPLSIVYPKGIKLDGSNPVHLYGYGSYGITDDPVYIPRFLAWYELGGVRATCHVRGGGAYGEEWHLAGKQATKPNTWKDFIACGEYLIKEGYTTSARLAINGGSAGGILVGRAMTERPDLFAVAAPQVGVLDALRSENSSNGIPNIPEFGTVKDEKQFGYLFEMDAYQHVKDGVKYPATLLMTGINDPRVPPWESFKMAARLQAASTSGKPVLMRIDYAAGHGVGSTKTQRQEEYADLWSFMLWQFGDARFQPAK
jgi:prolyl oligopeptidase